ncbi:MAG TPA: type II secretion system protein [Fimbriimonadaceae bacterium]|nr:type II secretion system protein [Fimbriimonadaceae bacterium]
MRSASKRLRGAFTLVEVLASIVLLGVGITAAVSALGSIQGSEARLQEKELRLRLASDQMREVLATGELETGNLSGDFANRGLERYRWEVEITASGTENLDRVLVRVTDAQARSDEQATTLETLVYRPPENGVQP